jgi:uncharacterized protein YndB with AHSA1/START domain
MVDILHRIGITASPEDVTKALTTVPGLSGWWTDDTHGDESVGGVIQFNFPVAGGDIHMKVLEIKPGELVRWEVVAGPPEWIATEVRFDLSTAGDYTIVLFKQEGWKEPVEFMYHCSTKWGSYLLSLKKYAETGQGDPAPRDLQISNWH